MDYTLKEKIKRNLRFRDMTYQDLADMLNITKVAIYHKISDPEKFQSWELKYMVEKELLTLNDIQEYV